MLTALRIQNFAIIDELEVRFTSGLNVLTGETGAGKSILVDALHLVLGGRARAEVIRTGADEATVEALFEGVDMGDRLAALGLPAGNGELLIRRVIQRSGRGRAWINGAIATIGLLEQVTDGLVDVSGQHEHVSLLNPDTHLSLLDGYAGLYDDVARYRAAWDDFSARLREKASVLVDDAERARRSDYLSFQLEEIEKLELMAGEDEALLQEKRLLGSAGRLRGAAEEAERALYSEDRSVCDLIGGALLRLQDAAAIDTTLEPFVASLRTARIEVEETSRGLSSYCRGIECDPGRLADVEDRLEAIRRLCRKHGGDLASVLVRRDQMREELQGIERHAERLEALGLACAEAGKRALAIGRELSASRARAAGEFATAVERELAGLAMAKTVFRVSVAPLPNVGGDGDEACVEGLRLGAHGLDTCELLLSPNAGEDVKPLARIASGGELSRVMLAIKRVLAKADPVLTYVFDEVDSGIGGAVAEVVGRLLKDVSRERQVISITHLPQIAAFAEQHLSVEKLVREGRTVSRVVPLVNSARTREIARMLAGMHVTKAAVKNAEEMIESASRRRR